MTPYQALWYILRKFYHISGIQHTTLLQQYRTNNFMQFNSNTLSKSLNQFEHCIELSASIKLQINASFYCNYRYLSSTIRPIYITAQLQNGYFKLLHCMQPEIVSQATLHVNNYVLHSLAMPISNAYSSRCFVIAFSFTKNSLL